MQEEAPSLGTPVLVMRENTERPEAVEAGVVKLIGTDEDMIVAQVNLLIHNAESYRTMSEHMNPYGDGTSGRRSVKAIAMFLNSTN